MNRTRFFLLAITLSGAALAAPVFKWTDAQGKVHYSDMPPPAGAQVKSQPVQIRGAAVSPMPEQKRSVSEAKKASSPVASAPAAAQPPSEKDPQACKQAMARKSFLESGQLTKSVNEKGEVEFMGVEKRKAELDEAQKAIERFCP